jgi:hypothetical protein
MGRKRKTIPPKLRFEVFKRDSFTCQYCGKSAPDVVLHVDHIEPHAEGGLDDIMNLITSCFDCNIGKGKRRLTDDTVVSKSKAQADLLNERRQQIEMMMEWRKELLNQEQEQLAHVNEYWSSLVPGYSMNERGQNSVTKLIKKFGLESVLDAMETAAKQYLKYDDDGEITKESVEEAFSKIGGICSVEKRTEKEPYIKELYYIRGILRNRMYVNENHVMTLLRSAVKAGIDTDKIKEISITERNWTSFCNEIEHLIGMAASQADEKSADEKTELSKETQLMGNAVDLSMYLQEDCSISEEKADEITDILSCYCGAFRDYVEKYQPNESDLADCLYSFIADDSFDSLRRLAVKYRERAGNRDALFGASSQAHRVENFEVLTFYIK